MEANTVLSALVLLSAFVLVANKRIRSYINTLRLQGVLIAVATAIAGVKSVLTGGRLDALLVCLIIVALKVWYIPNLLHKTYAGVEYRVEKDFFLNIPLLILSCCAIVVFAYFTVGTALGQGMELVNATSVVLIGLFFIISRRKAIGQIVGFLVIENGLFVTALFASDGMPFIVDMGVFIDLITAVLILGILVFRINTKFESIDIDKLNNLRG